MGAIVGAIAFLIYAALGILQFFAIVDGIKLWLNPVTVLAWIGALILAGMPVVGTVIGFLGAVKAWGWTWTQAGLLFFGPMLLFFAFAGFGIAIDKMRGR